MTASVVNSPRAVDTSLLNAANNGHVEQLLMAINSGAYANGRNDILTTALFKAVLNGHHECVLILVAYGADVNCRYKKYLNTPVLSIRQLSPNNLCS
jgi:ankyrin repeat protein